MKKILLLALFLALLLTACGGDGSGVSSEGIVEIPERFFVTQMESLRINADDYVGRTLRYEGLFMTSFWDLTGEDAYLIYRYVWDCCGNDGQAGFIIDLGDIEPFPDNAWVEVTGVLEWFEVDEFRFLRVAAISIREMEERGTEVVMP